MELVLVNGYAESEEHASSALCDLAGDMLMVFDIDPTPTVHNRTARLEFANQFGVFYVDNLR